MDKLSKQYIYCSLLICLFSFIFILQNILPQKKCPHWLKMAKTPLPPAAQTAPGQPREGSTHSHENAGEADHVIMMPEDEPVKKGDKKKKKDGKGGDEEKVKKKV